MKGAIILVLMFIELVNSSLGHDITYSTHGIHGNYINHNAHAYVIPTYPEVHHRSPYYAHQNSQNHQYTQHNKLASSTVSFHGNHAHPKLFANQYNQPSVYLSSQHVPTIYQAPIHQEPKKFHYVQLVKPLKDQVDHSTDISSETHEQKNDVISTDASIQAHEHKNLHDHSTDGSSETLQPIDDIDVNNSGSADPSPPPKQFRKVLVHRPALHKHFFDIEEHIVVRKVGSALIELGEKKAKVAAVSSTSPDISFEEGHENSVLRKRIQLDEPNKDMVANQTNSTQTKSNRLSLDELFEDTFGSTLEPELQPATEKSDVNDQDMQKNLQPDIFNQTLVDSTENSNKDILDAKTATSSVEKSKQDTVNQVVVDYIEQKRARDRFLEQNLKAQSNEPGSKFSEVFISRKQTSAEAQQNQENYIRLLTEQSNIAEIGNNKFSDQFIFNQNQLNGQVRGRVISASTIGNDAESRHVNTRRVVISRPVETVEEIEEEIENFQEPDVVIN